MPGDNKRIARFVPAAVAGVCMIVSAAAQVSPPNPQEANRDQFAADAWGGNMAEEELAKLAEYKGCQSSVRKLAHHLFEDHFHANTKLLSKMGGTVTLARTLPAKYQAMYDRLDAARCPEFDKEYVQQIAAEHQSGNR